MCNAPDFPAMGVSRYVKQFNCRVVFIFRGNYSFSSVFKKDRRKSTIVEAISVRTLKIIRGVEFGSVCGARAGECYFSVFCHGDVFVRGSLKQKLHILTCKDQKRQKRYTSTSSDLVYVPWLWHKMSAVKVTTRYSVISDERPLCLTE